MQRLYVLYDADCGLCARLRRWAQRQPAYVELVFLPAGSSLAHRLFPGLTKPGRPEELILVSDEGGVYRDDRAWIMCLFALKEYREWSLRLSQPALLPLARGAFALLSKNRTRVSRWLNLAGDAEFVEALRREVRPACEVGPETAGGSHQESSPV